MRMGLELSFCIIAYSVVSTVLPWEQMGVSLRWSTLFSWFGSCFAVIVFDQVFLCRSAFTLRKSYLLNLGGAYDKALELLDQIGPASNTLIRVPASIFHLFRAEVYMQCQDFANAEAELQMAEIAGAKGEQLYIAKSRFYRAQGDFQQAEQELEQAKKELEQRKETRGKSPVVRLEEGFLLFEKKDEVWAAKKTFKEVMEMPEEPHFAGETTYQLARAYWNATRLRAGEAEEGLEGLNRCIERLRSAVYYVDTLRPVLAQLLMERSYYYATHKEPRAAVADLKVGLMFCTYPSIVNKTKEIKDELEWRHDLVVT